VKRTDNDHIRNHAERTQFLYRWNTDRAALLEEWTNECPFCGRELLPRALDRDTGEWVEPDDYDQAQNVALIRRTSCGCEQEQAAVAVQKEQEKKAQLEHRRQAWAWALQQAGLEGQLARASFDSFQADTPQRAEWLRLCQGYCADLLRDDLRGKPWLVLYGQYGTGKTHLAAAVIREALGHGWTGCYLRPWLSYLRRLMDSFGEEPQERTADIAQELAAGRLVAIDDIDNDRANVSRSGFAETELFRALNERYLANRPTILTFNRHPLQMTPWLGASGVDRLLHYSYAVVEFSGESYRSGQQWQAPGDVRAAARGER
jgi:DNA replication protein DnaC